MNERQREQIGRIIVHSTATASAALGLGLIGVQSKFALAGRSGSGAEMVAASEEVARGADCLLNQLVSKIAPVCRTPDAFEEIETAIGRWLRSASDELREYSRKVRSTQLQGHSLSQEIGDRELAKLDEVIQRRLEIERFDFEPVASLPMQLAPPRIPKKGGRPPAEFWDDMWAAIAVMLYDGSLKPKSQADVARAMTDWIEGKGFSSADSSVKARARRLWDKIDSLDE